MKNVRCCVPLLVAALSFWAGAVGAAERYPDDLLITLSSETVGPGETVEVQVSGLPGNRQDWLTLTEVESSPLGYGEWTYTNGVKEGSWTFTAPKTPGDYEIRVYFDFSSGDKTIRARQPLVVTTTPNKSVSLRSAEPQNQSGADKPQTSAPRLSLSSQIVLPSEPFEVTINGLPGNAQDWISLAEPDAPPGSFDSGRWRYTKGVTDGIWKYTAPPDPGEYEIRVYFDYPHGGNTIHARVALLVTEEPEVATLSAAQQQAEPDAPEQVAQISLLSETFGPQEPIEVSISGLPSSGKHWISLVPKDARESAWNLGVNMSTEGEERFGYVVAAPFEAGTYELRVHLNGSYVVNARQAFEVVPYQARNCKPSMIGSAYQSSKGAFTCEATEDGVRCQYAVPKGGQDPGFCGLSMNLALTEDGSDLIGEWQQDSEFGIARFILDEQCDIAGGHSYASAQLMRMSKDSRHIYSWNVSPDQHAAASNERSKQAGVQASVRSDLGSACTIETLGRHYVFKAGGLRSFDCQVKNAGFECQEVILGELLAGGFRVKPIGEPNMQLRLSPNGREVNGAWTTTRAHQSLQKKTLFLANFPVDERCNLTGGYLTHCSSRSQRIPLDMYFDWRRTAKDTTSAEAQTEMGKVNAMFGRLVKAYDNYSNAADQGYAEAQFLFAKMIENRSGRGTAQRMERATALYEMAAQQGHVEAQENFERRQAEIRAVAERTRQAEGGDVDAQFEMGIIYLYGSGVTGNPDTALAWLEKAAAQDDARAVYEIGMFYYRHSAPDRELARSYFEKSADMGFHAAHVALAGLLFVDGREGAAKERLAKALESSDERVRFRAKSLLRRIEAAQIARIPMSKRQKEVLEQIRRSSADTANQSFNAMQNF